MTASATKIWVRLTLPPALHFIGLSRYAPISSSTRLARRDRSRDDSETSRSGITTAVTHSPGGHHGASALCDRQLPARARQGVCEGGRFHRERWIDDDAVDRNDTEGTEQAACRCDQLRTGTEVDADSLRRLRWEGFPDP